LPSIRQKTINIIKASGPIVSLYRFLYWNFYTVFKQFAVPFRVILQIKKIKHQILFVREVIREQKIDAVLIADSGPGSSFWGLIIIQAAHGEGIPVITAPLGKWSTDSYAEAILTSRYLHMKNPLVQLIGAIFPKWVYNYIGIRMIPVEPELLLALEFLHLNPPNPWLMVSNNEDAVAVDSIDTFEHYSNNGVAPEKMIIIGIPEHDIMAEFQSNSKRLRTELCERLNLPVDRPIILSALVQDHYLGGRPTCDFQKYEDMVEFWVKSLGSINGYNIIISLHPSDGSKNYDYIEQWGVKICRDDLSTLIPLCDIYVAPGFSTTTPWAITCCKPVILYDVFRWGNPTYQSAPGVITVQEKSEFLDELKKLTSDPEYYTKIVALQVLVAKNWGNLDGKATERLLHLFERQSIL
jgi:hypothetical protein